MRTFGVAAMVAILAGCGAGGSAESTAAETVTVTATQTVSTTVEVTPMPEPAAELPKAKDFKIGVKIRRQACFGSAGCNVSFQVNPSYTGPLDVSTGSYDITYQVSGGDSGPMINTMTLEDGTFSYPREEMLSTSGTPRLTATVTSVSER